MSSVSSRFRLAVAIALLSGIVVFAAVEFGPIAHADPDLSRNSILSLTAGDRTDAVARRVEQVLPGNEYASIEQNAPRRTASFLNLQEARKPVVRYHGDNDAIAALLSGSAEPRALASGDIDGNGTADVAAAYAYGYGGILVVQRGNPEAFAPEDDSVYVRLQQGYNPESLLPDAEVYALPARADFVAVGSFQQGGIKDILFAAQGGGLYLMRGDGSGNFGAPGQIPLPGPVTAMGTGEFRSVDGAKDVAVGVSGPDGNRLVIFDGAMGFTDPIAQYGLPGAATSIELDGLDSDPFQDVAVSAGNELLIAHGWGRKQAAESKNQNRIERVALGTGVRALATGHFTWDREGRKEVAVLTDSGSVEIVEGTELDVRPFTESEIENRGRSRLNQAGARRDVDVETLQGWRPASRKAWKTSEWAASFKAGDSRGGLLAKTHLGYGELDEIALSSDSESKLEFLRTDGPNDLLRGAPTGLDARPVAVLTLPRKLNGVTDVIVLNSASSEISVIPNAPNTTITVDRTDDPSGASLAGVSVCNNAVANDCSLRGAFEFANNAANPGTTINLPAGTYILSTNGTSQGGCDGNATGDLAANQSTSIVGAGAATTVIRQTGTGPGNDGDRIMCMNELFTVGLIYNFSAVSFIGGREGVEGSPNVGTALGGAGIIGGELDNSLTLTNVVFANNQSVRVGSGNIGGGGLQITGGNLIITNSTFGGSSAPGAYTDRSSTNTANSTVSSGGGVMYTPSSPMHDDGIGTLTVTGTTFSRNTSAGIGGGGLDLAIFAFAGNGGIGSGTASIGTSTLSNNSAANGGGIIVESLPTTINSSTNFNNNSASNRGGGIYVGGGSLLLNGAALPAITFSGNTATSAGSSISTTGAPVNVDGTNTTLGGDIEINTGAVWTNNAGSTLSPTDVVVNGGTFTMNNSTMNVSGDLTIAAAPLFPATFNGGSGTVNLQGDFSFNTAGAGATFNAGTGTFNFNGTGAQSITNSASITFNNLTDSNITQPLTLNNSLAVGGSLNVNGANAIFSPVAGAVISGSGTLTGTGTARASRIAPTADFLTQYTISNKTLTNLTVDYFGGGAQTVNALTYGNLTTSTSGTKTLGGAVTVGKNLTIGTGTTLDVSATNHAINAAGNWTNNGTFTPRSGTVTFNGGAIGQDILGNTSFFNLTLNNGGSINFNGTTTTIQNNLVTTAGNMQPQTSTIVFTGAAGSISGAQPKRFNNLQINAGAGISNSTGGDATIFNDYQNNGTFTQAAALMTTFSTGADGSHSLSGSGSTTFGKFTVNASNTVDAGSHNFSVVGTPFDVPGTFTGNTGTVTFNGAVAQAIAGSGLKNFSGLTINNANGVTVNNDTSGVDATVSGVLTLSTNLGVASGGILQQSGTSAGTGDVIGTVRRTDLGGTARAFGNPFNTVQVNSGTAPTQLDFNLVKSAPATFPAAITRDYTLTPTGGSGFSATMSLHYLNSELNGNTEPELTFWKNIAGTWTVQGRTSNDTVNKAVTLAGITGFSEWTLADRPDTTISSLNRVTASPTNASSVQWTATFANPVFGLTTTNFTLVDTNNGCTGESISAVNAVGGSPATSWTIDVNTGSGDCILRLDLANDTGVSHDVTTVLPFAGETIGIDKTPPATSSFVRQSPATSPTNSDTLVFRATFSEAVIGVDSGDFTVTGTTATVTNVAGVGGSPNFTQYDVTVSSGDLAGLNGTVGLNFNVAAPANFITDLATNNLPKTEPATDQTYLVDNQPPTVSMTSAAPDPTNTSPIPVTVTFNENVTGFTLSDIVAGNATTGNFVPVNGAVYTFALTPTGQGLVTADIAAGVAQDTAGNLNTAATQFSRTYDSVGPTVTIDQKVGQADPAFSNPIDFTVVFNEAVTDFDDPTDVTITGTATGTPTVVITPISSTQYTVSVSGITGDGTVIATIGAGKAVDAALNPNAASTSTDNTVTFLTCANNPVVNSTADTNTPGTLRYSVNNICPAPNNNITFGLPTDSMITLGGTALIVAKDLKITGPATRVTINGGAASRIFTINSGINATISSLNLTNGKDNGAGAIQNDGTLVLIGMSIFGNASDADGGAMRNDGTATIIDSTITNNTAKVDGGGILNGATRTLTLLNTTITTNTADSDNNASGDGGGILSAGTLVVKNSIVTGNTKSGGTVSDVTGTMTGSNNIIGTAAGLAITFQGNGGPTKNYSLTVGSLAIDAGTDATTLGAAIPDAVTTSVTVSDATFTPSGLVIRIDNELMLVTAAAGNTLTVTRGFAGSTAAAHNNGAGVNPAYDQRGTGFGRKVGTAVDIGAFEAAPVGTITDANAASDAVPEGAADGTGTGFTASASDANGGTITYLLTDNAGGRFTVDPSSGAVTVAAGGGALLDYETATSHQITVQASNGIYTSTASFTINVTDVPPTAPADSNVAANQVSESTTNGTLVGITASSTDANGPVVSYSLTTNPNGAFQIGASDGVVSVADATKIDFETSGGSYTIGVTATAGIGSTAANMTVNVLNVAPTGVNDGYMVNEDTPLTVNTAQGVLANDTDPNGGVSNASIVTGPASSASFTLNGDGSFSYTPAANFSGSDSFTYKPGDGNLQGNTTTVSITVNPSNDAPVFTKGANQTVNEDSGAQTVVGWATGMSPGGGADEAGQALNFIVGNDNNSLFSVPPAVDAVTGTLTYTPAANAFGTATVTVQLHDNGGTANSGVDTSAGQTFTITVNGVNDAPSFTKGADQTVNEDAGAQSVTNWATNISAGPNEGSQTLTFQVTNNTNAGLFSAGPASSSTGTLTYTPTANANGTATITIQLMDNGGTANSGVDTSPTQTFTITVNSVNDVPSFTKGANQTVNEDAGAQTVAGWATNLSPGGGADEAGQTLNFIVTNDNNGLFSSQPAVAANGTLTYTPAANANGSATVSVQIHDNGGTTNGGVDTSAVQTFTITVNAVNDVPTFTKGANQTFKVNEGAKTISNWATAISAGPADESSQTLTFQVSNDNNGLFSSQPAIGSTGTLTFTSAAYQVGTATVTVTLKDNGGTANGGADTSTPAQTFTITIQQGATSGVLTSSPNPSALNQQVTFTATISAVAPSTGPPQGSVEFREGANVLGTGAINGAGVATFQTSALSSGHHFIFARYVATAAFATSDSNVVDQLVDLPPSAVGSAPNVTGAAGVTHTVTVVYTDDFSVNVSSIDSNDIRVTGPNGFNSAVTFQSVTPNTNGSPRTATYTFTAPGGVWDIGDNGSYSIVMQASQVVDSANQPVPAGTIGTFTVNIPPVSISGNIKSYIQGGPNTNLGGVTVTVTSANSPQVPVPAPVTTDASGNYTIAGLSSGGSYVVTPSLGAMVPDPLNRTYNTLTNNVTNADFVMYANQAGVPRIVSIPNTYVAPGDNAAVPVVMVSQGTETFVSFSIAYDPNVIAAGPTASCGSSTTGCTVSFNNATPGVIGVTVTNAVPFNAGPRQVAVINFMTLPTSQSNTPLSFGINPTAQLVRNAANDPLPAQYVNGLVVFAQGLEGDVSARKTGNGVLDATDVAEVRLMVAGVDKPDPNFNEFQRADTAPASTKGNGILDAVDIVQTRLYFASINAPTGSGGPGSPPQPPLGVARPDMAGDDDTAVSRTIGIKGITADKGTTVTIPVEIQAAGSEVAASFTVNYDAARLTNARVSLSDRMPKGTVLTVNASEEGRLGIVIDGMEPFSTTSAPASMIELTFDIAADAAGRIPLTFTSDVASKGTSDAGGNGLSTRYIDASIAVAGTDEGSIDISGHVFTPDGRGLRNATVNLSDANGNILRSAVTSSFGAFSFDRLSSTVGSEAWNSRDLKSRPH